MDDRRHVVDSIEFVYFWCIYLKSFCPFYFWRGKIGSLFQVFLPFSFWRDRIEIRQDLSKSILSPRYFLVLAPNPFYLKSYREIKIEKVLSLELVKLYSYFRLSFYYTKIILIKQLNNGLIQWHKLEEGIRRK